MEGESNLSKILTLVRSNNQQSVFLGWELAKTFKMRNFIIGIVKRDLQRASKEYDVVCGYSWVHITEEEYNWFISTRKILKTKVDKVNNCLKIAKEV